MEKAKLICNDNNDIKQILLTFSVLNVLKLTLLCAHLQCKQFETFM